MDDGWEIACSVVDAALDKKYGTVREKLDLERLKARVLGTQEVVAASDAGQRKAAIVQALVDAISQPAPHPKPIAALAPVAAPAPVPVPVSAAAPKPLRSRASFVPLRPSGKLEWRPETQFAGTVSALYMGDGAADLGESPWPCVVLEAAGLEPNDNDGYRACSAAFTVLGTAGGRCIYKGELQVAVGPATTFSLRGCDAGPIEIAWEGRIAERVADQSNALSRIHKLRELEPAEGHSKWWSECWTMSATDSLGKPCGAVDASSKCRDAITIVPLSSGAQPSLIFLQGALATMCVTQTTPPTAT
jgi:hypothetical protein